MIPSWLTPEDRADITERCFSRAGVRPIATRYDMNKVSVMRVVQTEVALISAWHSSALHRGRITIGGRKYQLRFGEVWQSDGKDVRTTEIYANSNSVIKRQYENDGVLVIKYDQYVENIVEKLNHFCLTSMPLPSMNCMDRRLALRDADRVAGPPRALEVDRDDYLKVMWPTWRKTVELRVLHKVGEISQVPYVEAFNGYMDLKLKSGFHGRTPWMLPGVQLTYNYVERKDELGGLTPAQHAGFPQLLDEHMWLSLHNLATEWQKDIRRP